MGLNIAFLGSNSAYRSTTLLGFMASRLPDREQRVEEFFLRVAARMPEAQFVLGGTGWSERALPSNVRAVGHVYGRELFVVEDGVSLSEQLKELSEVTARRIGQAAQRAVLAQHTYAHRSSLLEATLGALGKHAFATTERQLSK